MKIQFLLILVLLLGLTTTLSIADEIPVIEVSEEEFAKLHQEKKITLIHPPSADDNSVFSEHEEGEEEKAQRKFDAQKYKEEFERGKMTLLGIEISRPLGPAITFEHILGEYEYYGDGVADRYGAVIAAEAGFGGVKAGFGYHQSNTCTLGFEIKASVLRTLNLAESFAVDRGKTYIGGELNFFLMSFLKAGVGYFCTKSDSKLESYNCFLSGGAGLQLDSRTWSELMQ